MDISAASQREREKEGEIENQIPGLDYVTGSYLEWSVEYLERALSTDHRTTVAFGCWSGNNSPDLQSIVKF